MIKLIFGNVGSGKTASSMRWMRNNSHLCIVTNIHVERMKHVIPLKPEMIILKEKIGEKRSGQIIYDLKLNTDFWKSFIATHKHIHVVIDEAHTFFNPRRSMSKINIIMGDFLALLRRVVGSVGEREGSLVLITQLGRRLDVYAREMSTDVEYYIAHYTMTCNKCKLSWQEHNEQARKLDLCPRCGHYNIIKHKYIIERYSFKDYEHFDAWRNSGLKSYYARVFIHDIETIFNRYNTHQWEDLLSGY